MSWFQNLFSRFKGRQQSQTANVPDNNDPIASDDSFRRAMGGAGNSSGWSSDHREEANHNTGFNYIAVHAIATQVGSATVTAFYDGNNRDIRQSRRKSLAKLCGGSFTRWKSIYGQEDRQTDPLPSDHPLIKILKRPNPHESGHSFRYRQAQQLRLTGRCLIWNVPSQLGVTCERYIIPTSMATWMMPTPQFPMGGWRVSMNGSRYVPLDDNGFIPGIPGIYMLLGATVDARQIQDIRYPHAWWLGDGWSPVMAGAAFIDGSTDIAVARSAHLRNGVQPAIVLSRKEGADPITDVDILERAQKAFNKKYAGPYNEGKTLWAPDGTEVTIVGADAKDMAYPEGHKDFREAVFALHQVSPVAAGIQEAGTGSAYFTSMKQTRHAAIQPLCDMLAESDTEFLAPQFGEGITVEYEAAALDDDDQENKEFAGMTTAQSFTRNELRAKKGYPQLPGPEGEEIVGKPSTGGQPAKPDDVADPEQGQTQFAMAGQRSKALDAAILAAEDGDFEWLASKLKAFNPDEARDESGKWTAASKISVKLSELAKHSDAAVDEAESLDPSSDHHHTLIAKDKKGRIDLLDGHHRIAGYVKWAQEHDKPLDSVDVPAIHVHDEDLAGRVSDAESPSKQREAILEAEKHAGTSNGKSSRYRKKSLALFTSVGSDGGFTVPEGSHQCPHCDSLKTFNARGADVRGVLEVERSAK